MLSLAQACQSWCKNLVSFSPKMFRDLTPLPTAAPGPVHEQKSRHRICLYRCFSKSVSVDFDVSALNDVSPSHDFIRHNIPGLFWRCRIRNAAQLRQTLGKIGRAKDLPYFGIELLS